MTDLMLSFEDRLDEIATYLDLLDSLEEQVQIGPPRLAAGPVITAKQQQILYASVYLQLYNLVESTITQCMDALSSAVTEGNSWLPSDLSDELRREWVRHVARTHVADLNVENRLRSALLLCEHLVQSLPISVFKIDKGGGGNWDDQEIETLGSRLGLNLTITRHTRTRVKRFIHNNQGSLTYIKELRNSLAHGSISFAECGAGRTARELRDLTDTTSEYLKEVVVSFEQAIATHAFLVATRRP